MIKRLEKYEQYKASLSKLNKAKLKFENMQKLFEASQEISDKLSTTLGIEKIGEQIDFEQIEKAERQKKIKSREVKIAEKEYLKAEEKLKETILEIKNLRKIEIKKIGRAINRKVLKIIKDIAKLKKGYTQLEREIKSDFESLEIEGGYSAVIGADPRQIDFSTPMSYSTEFYLKRSKIYQSKKEKEH